MTPCTRCPPRRPTRAGAAWPWWPGSRSSSPSPRSVHPVGVAGTPGKILTAMAGGSVARIAAAGLAAVLSLVFRYRRAQAAERAQLRWLGYAGGLVVGA